MVRTTRHLYTISWGVVAYTVLIILWGAWVRLSGSGDGCGDHWPLCNGEVLPTERITKTWIEYSHRISTAVYGIVVLFQIWWTRKFFKPKHPARFWAIATLLFTITEALIGRQLVKSGLVNESTDISRLFVMPLHLINTSLLLFSGVMTAESIEHGDTQRRPLSSDEKRLGSLYIIGLSIVLTTGAIAALGSHLMPSESLLHGLTHDLAPDSHPAVKLRILHPLLALVIPVGLILFAQIAVRERAASSQGMWYRRFALTTGIAVAIGLATLSLLAPVWLKLTHLLMTNILVIVFSLCVFHTLRPVEQVRKTNVDLK
jgi:cytochrome c oxidase assembly protein subunit 15